jgi:hypothetical protein
LSVTLLRLQSSWIKRRRVSRVAWCILECTGVHIMCMVCTSCVCVCVCVPLWFILHMLSFSFPCSFSCCNI